MSRNCKQETLYPFGELTIESGKHYAFSASKFEERWERIQQVVEMRPAWTVSLKSEDTEGVSLSVDELKDNRAFVFEMGENKELVRSTAPREEAKLKGIKKGFFGSLKKMESELISLVNEQSAASSSVRQDEDV